MAKLYVVGDLHIRKEEPFFSSASKVLELVLGDMEDGDEVLFLGDVFHGARPYASELGLFNGFMENIGKLYPSSMIRILAGNHEYLEVKDSFVEDSYLPFKNVDFIDKPSLLTSKACPNVGLLMLPYVPLHRLVRDYNVHSMNELYEGVILKEWQDKMDGGDGSVNFTRRTLICYHFEDETQFMGLEHKGVDLNGYDRLFSYSKRLGGHIHVRGGNYLGTPYQTRVDEAGNDGGSIFVVDDKGSESYLHVPQYVQFSDIPYGELPDASDGVQHVIKVVNAPSADAVSQMYGNLKGVYVRDYEVRSSEERVDGEVGDMDANKSISEMLDDFFVKNKVDKATAGYIRSIM